MKKLIFVYNADSGQWNAYMDVAHKIFSPSTYPCSLCDITYGIFKIRPEWEEFIKHSPIPFEFLHKDEFVQLHPNEQKIPLPVVLLQSENEPLETFISEKELAALKNIEELKVLILSRL
jgi:hypothetical protein